MGKVEQFLERAKAIEQGLLDIGHASKASGVSVKIIRWTRRSTACCSGEASRSPWSWRGWRRSR